MKKLHVVLVAIVCGLFLVQHAASQSPPTFPADLSMTPPRIGTDPSVTFDYPIVYVRAPRNQTSGRSEWAEVGNPRRMQPNSPLMILYPNGTEEVLVPVTAEEAIADPMVSIDGEWVYYAKMYDALRSSKGSDIFKVKVATKEIVQLTHQERTPNTGVGTVPVHPYKVHNLGPCELPDGRFVFVSDRNVYEATNPNYAPNALALQLFVADAADGGNIEEIGHLNLGMALHPVVLKDGRIMFSSLEGQGLRSQHLWGLWSIHPDGTNWSPLFSAFGAGSEVTESLHFQTQTSDGYIVAQEYYNLNNFGMGPLFMFPVDVPGEFSPEGPQRAFGPARKQDPRNPAVRFGRMPGGGGIYWRYPFSPYGLESLTPFVIKTDEPSNPAILTQPSGDRVGKTTHPSGAPDNHVLVVWSPGSVYGHQNYVPAFDAGIYLIKSRLPVDEPSDMRLIKNDPLYNEMWPRAVVPYGRIYGVEKPSVIPRNPNRGTLHAALPEGTPFGLVGTSSLYKRETFPNGGVPEGSVTAQFIGTDTSGWKGLMSDSLFNMTVQGADVGVYSNSDIHAIRIVQLEPTTELNNGRQYYNHAREKMRILGEIPVREFLPDGSQPRDPDGNPDTSFLAKIPANVAWTFQTIDKDGLVLNTSQTWHQLKPGETRTTCGGCHAHSQTPTEFKFTKAGQAAYTPFDLTTRVPLVTSHEKDESGKRWDSENKTGLRYVQASSVTVEYHKDIVPIFQKSCVPCHTSKNGATPAMGLDLDNDTIVSGETSGQHSFRLSGPRTYITLAADHEGEHGMKSWTLSKNWGAVAMKPAASRYLKMHQARRSLLVWTVYGRRLDGYDNEDIPYLKNPLDDNSWSWKGQPIIPTTHQRNTAHIGFVGSAMPPPEAVASGLVQPLTDEDRRTIARWVDLGAPIDLSATKTTGWHLDDQRPTLVVTYPAAGVNESFSKIVVGMHDLGSGVNLPSLSIVFDKAVGGVPAGTNVASRLTASAPGTRSWTFSPAMPPTEKVVMTASVKDAQGNETRFVRTFSVGTGPTEPPPPPEPVWTRKGCIAAAPDQPLRYQLVFNDPTLTLDKAITVARAGGFRYFGLADGDTVRADYEFTLGTPQFRPESECPMPLHGQPEVLSGVGEIRWALYEVSPWTMPPNPLPPPVPVPPCPVCPVCPTCPTPPVTGIEKLGTFVEKSPRVWKEIQCTTTTPVCRTLEHRGVLTIEIAEFEARQLGAKLFALQNGNLLYISRDPNIDYDKYGPSTGKLKPCEGNAYSDNPTTCGGNMITEVYRVK